MSVFLTILLGLLVFGLLILTHEMGHYFFARLFHVTIKEFSVGMGPKIVSKQSEKTGIAYSLRALPIGGYVAMAGEDDTSDDPNALYKKPVWQRMIITAAGGVVNVIIGFIVISVMVTVMPRLGSNVIHSFAQESVSSAWLEPGDQVIAVNGARVYTSMDLIYEVSRLGIKPLDITVMRGGEKITLHDVTFPTTENRGVLFGDVDFYVYAAEKTPANVLKQAYCYCTLTVRQIWESLYDLITGRYGMEAASGPVGVVKELGNAAQSGLTGFLYLVGMISVNLGLVNLLPFPALDGGRLAFQLVELVTGKRLSVEVEGMIHLVGILILFGFMIFITFKDVRGLFH